MNTEKSDQFIQTWLGTDHSLKRASFVTEKRFNAPPEVVFPLLCPTTELDWIPNWTCDLLHSNSGRAEYNAIFRTRFFGPEEIWVCTRYEVNRAIDYSRTSADVAAVMAISLADHCDGTTTGQWVVTISALGEKGNAAVSQIELGRQHLSQVLDGLEHYIDTGQMIS